MTDTMRCTTCSQTKRWPAAFPSITSATCWECAWVDEGDAMTVKPYPDRDWFIEVDSACSHAAYRELPSGSQSREILRRISFDARRFADKVGDRYVGGFPITAETMRTMLEAEGFRVFRPDDCEKMGVGSWWCSTCGNDCRASGPGCEGSKYGNTDYWLVPVEEKTVQ